MVCAIILLWVQPYKNCKEDNVKRKDSFLLGQPFVGFFSDTTSQKPMSNMRLIKHQKYQLSLRNKQLIRSTEYRERRSGSWERYSDRKYRCNSSTCHTGLSNNQSSTRALSDKGCIRANQHQLVAGVAPYGTRTSVAVKKWEVFSTGISGFRRFDYCKIRESTHLYHYGC